MIYYVKSGDVDTSLKASSHKQAAIRAIRGSGEELGVCVMVNENEICEANIDDSVFFLTQSLLDECSMTLVR